MSRKVMRLSERGTGKVKGQTEVLTGGNKAQREQVRLDASTAEGMVASGQFVLDPSVSGERATVGAHRICPTVKLDHHMPLSWVFSPCLQGAWARRGIIYTLSGANIP